MDKKKNLIYLFYEPVNVDSDGTSIPGNKYYKCFHGSRKTLKLTPGMKHNLKRMWISFPFSIFAHLRLLRYGWSSSI